MRSLDGEFFRNFQTHKLTIIFDRKILKLPPKAATWHEIWGVKIWGRLIDKQTSFPTMTKKCANYAGFPLPDPFSVMGARRETTEPRNRIIPRGMDLKTYIKKELSKSVRCKEHLVGQYRMRWRVSKVGRPHALHEGFSMLPFLEKQEFNRRLCRCSEDERGHNEKA